MPAQVLARLRPKALIAAVFVALPAILFYAILYRQALNIPFQDDYEALFDFLNQISQLKTVSAKFSYFFAAQYNEYKLFFEHGLVWLQFALFGHIDIRVLCTLGNGFVLLLAILLWKMFLPDHKNLSYRMAFFIPVSWLLFQLQYVETLDWAMASLQCLPVLVFSLGAIYLLVRATQWAFYGALACLVLAVASSGNGLFVIPVGVWILAADRRQYAHVVGWLATSVGCVSAYAYRYDVMSSQSPIHHSILATVNRPRPLYVIAFMGSAASPPTTKDSPLLFLGVVLCTLLGTVLCIFLVYIARRGYIRKNPLVSYCIIFLLLTAVGVAGLRSDVGITGALASRYGMYSALFLIFAWFAIVEEFLQYESAPLRRNCVLLTVIAAAVLFSLRMDARGWIYLTERNHEIALGMAAYEHPASPQFNIGPILRRPNQGVRFDELDRRAPEILRQSTKLGIFRPVPPS